MQWKAKRLFDWSRMLKGLQWPDQPLLLKMMQPDATRFVQKNSEWLKTEINLSHLLNVSQPTPSLSQRRGRPRKLFWGSFERTKARDVALLLSEVDHQKLAYATQKSLSKSGKRTAAEVVKLATNSSPRSLKKIKMAPKMSPAITPYTPEEALALTIDSGLGKVNYLNIQSETKKKG
ncbi:hypothetical protein ILUMI_21625, partial [Ignelater luminosus]